MLPLVLLIVGLVVLFIGDILILIAAFKESILWGLGALFLPIVGLIFVALHWREAKSGVYAYILGIVLVVTAVVLSPDPQERSTRQGLPADADVEEIDD